MSAGSRPRYSREYVAELDRLLAARPHNHVIDDDLEVRPLDYYPEEALLDEPEGANA